MTTHTELMDYLRSYDYMGTYCLAVDLLRDFALINKNDLPPVSVTHEGVLKAGDHQASPSSDPAHYFAFARECLALALHLEANPPIDKVEVGNLRALLNAAPMPYGPTDLATWLVRNGVTVR